MERVTQWFGDETHGREAGLADKYDGVYLDDELIQVLLNRLATYEDTGMTPEEIKGADEFLKENWEMPLERLVEGMELIMAKDSGRLVVLPCKVVYVPTWDAGEKCDLVCPISVDGKGCCDFCDKAEMFIYERPCRQEHIEQIGKTVFLTRQEAEAAVSQITQ